MLYSTSPTTSASAIPLRIWSSGKLHRRSAVAMSGYVMKYELEQQCGIDCSHV